MKGGTLFSGIGAPEVSAPAIDWRWCAEIDPFACAVLAERIPHTRNLGDVTKLEGELEPVDLLVFGSPCQSFSVAGKRAGLDDPRGDLTLVGLALAGRVRPRWVVWENVPGVLSIDEGRTFGAVLGILGQLGYGFAYRVLDAQHFGVPQRRRRVFVVGCLGDWRPAAAVLFERESLSGNPPPRREAGEGTAGGSGRSAAFGGNNTGGAIDIATAVNAHGGPHGRLDFESETFIAFNARQDPVHGDIPGPLDTDGSTQASAVSLRGREGGGTAELSGEVATALRASQGGGDKPHVMCVTGEIAHTLKADGFDAGEDGTGRGQPIVPHGLAVRRLTPRECERLQGFPDDFTLVTYRGKPAADGPRYRALGNSMAVPVIGWILDRIRQVDAILAARSAA